MTWNSDGMWRMWISPKIYPKKQASMVIGMWEWHAWQMLTAASMAGCSHGFLGQNSAPVWSTCQSFQIKSSTQTERLYKNIQYTSVYMQKQLTQMTLYDVIMSVPQDGFDGFVTKDGSDSPLFTLCSYSEPLQQPARSVSKSSNNNWRAHLVMAWNWLPDTGWVRSSKLWHLRDCPWAQKHGVRHFNFSAQRLGGKVFGAFFVGLTWRFANPPTLDKSLEFWSRHTSIGACHRKFKLRGFQVTQSFFIKIQGINGGKPWKQAPLMGNGYFEKTTENV